MNNYRRVYDGKSRKMILPILDFVLAIAELMYAIRRFSAGHIVIGIIELAIAITLIVVGVMFICQYKGRR